MIISERSVYDNLKKCAKEFGSLCAIDYFGREISYWELVREVNRCACALVACGINRGDVVTVCLPNIPQAVYLFYAANKLGAIADIIDPYIEENEISIRLEQSGSKYIFALDRISDKIEDVADKIDLKLIVTASASDEMPVVMKAGDFIKNFGRKKNLFTDWYGFISKASPSDRYISVHGAGDATAAYLRETDDTSQRIEISNKCFNDFALYCLDECGNIDKADRVLAVIPISRGFGIGTCVHSVFSTGGTAVILPDFNNNDIDKAIVRYCPNVIAGDSDMYKALAESSGFKGKDVSFIRTVVFTGSRIEPDLKRQIREKLSSHGSVCRICELKSINDFTNEKRS